LTSTPSLIAPIPKSGHGYDAQAGAEESRGMEILTPDGTILYTDVKILPVPMRRETLPDERGWLYRLGLVLLSAFYDFARLENEENRYVDLYTPTKHRRRSLRRMSR
jgi:hypothetical protein